MNKLIAKLLWILVLSYNLEDFLTYFCRTTLYCLYAIKTKYQINERDYHYFICKIIITLNATGRMLRNSHFTDRITNWKGEHIIK